MPPAGGPVQLVERWSIDQAEDGPAVADERDVDRELRPPRCKFARAVQRVDEEEFVFAIDAVAKAVALFGNDRDTGCDRRKCVEEDFLGQAVRSRHRRAIGLGLGNRAGFEDRHDLAARLHYAWKERGCKFIGIG